jgi:hypothetical protein
VHPTSTVAEGLHPPTPAQPATHANHTCHTPHAHRQVQGCFWLAAPLVCPELLQEPAAGITAVSCAQDTPHHQHGGPRAAATSSSTHAQPSTPTMHATPTTDSDNPSTNTSKLTYTLHTQSTCTPTPPRCPLSDRRALEQEAETAAMHQTKSKDALRISHKFAQPQLSRFCWRCPSLLGNHHE